MIWLIVIGIGLILAAIGLILYGCSNRFERKSSLFWSGFIIACVSFVVGIMFTAGNTFDYTFSEEPVLRETTEITSLADRYSVKGNFFLGSGTVSSEDYYYFIKNTDNGKITDKILQKETYITEDNSQKPRIEEYAYEGEQNPTKDFWLSMNLGADKDDFSYKFAYYRVFIPEGSIKSDFSVDFE